MTDNQLPNRLFSTTSQSRYLLALGMGLVIIFSSLGTSAQSGDQLVALEQSYTPLDSEIATTTSTPITIHEFEEYPEDDQFTMVITITDTDRPVTLHFEYKELGHYFSTFIRTDSKSVSTSTGYLEEDSEVVITFHARNLGFLDELDNTTSTSNGIVVDALSIASLNLWLETESVWNATTSLDIELYQQERDRELGKSSLDFFDVDYSGAVFTDSGNITNLIVEISFALLVAVPVGILIYRRRKQ